MPADPQTLPQIYQRWDYAEYAYHWGWQSAAVKREYASLGVRYHLTGFQYWMRTSLRSLFWLGARYHLDRHTDPIAYDSSKQGNNGTIFGTTLAGGVINGARYFDGINDHITVPDSPSLRVAEPAIEFFVLMGAQTVFNQDYISKRNAANNAGFVVRRLANTDTMVFYFRINAAWWPLVYVVPNTSIWHHFAVSYNTVQIRLFVDGVLQAPVNVVGSIDWDTNDLEIGKDPPLNRYWAKATIDEVVLFIRIPDDSLIIEHSQRRYPL